MSVEETILDLQGGNMSLDDRTGNLFMSAGSNKCCRRSFIAKSAGCTALLPLLSSAGIGTEPSLAQENKSREETIRELEIKAVTYMSNYGSCAKSTFAALNDQFNLKADAIVPAIMPFTGGIAGRGETCGAVSGAILALGLFFECVKQREKKSAGSSMNFGGLFFDSFEKEFGSTRCREVMKHQYGRYVDFRNPEDMKLFAAESQKGEGCLGVVKRAAVLAAGIILENAG